MKGDRMALDFSKLRDIVSALAPDSDLSDFDAETSALAETSAGADAKIEELTSQLADSEARYRDTAARNYELMQAASGPAESDSDDSESDDEPDDEDTQIRSLFGDADQ